MNLHLTGFNVLFFKCAFLAKLISFHACECGIQSTFTHCHRRYVTRVLFSSSFNRSYDYNIHLYNQAICIKTPCVLLLCCPLFFHCLRMNKSFPLIFAQSNTHTQGIAVIDSKSRAHLHVTSKMFHGAQKHNVVPLLYWLQSAQVCMDLPMDPSCPGTV